MSPRDAAWRRFRAAPVLHGSWVLGPISTELCAGTQTVSLDEPIQS